MKYRWKGPRFANDVTQEALLDYLTKRHAKWAPRLLCERGVIDRSLRFVDLKERSHINKKAQAADASPDFSQLIRAGLPEPTPAP